MRKTVMYANAATRLFCGHRKSKKKTTFDEHFDSIIRTAREPLPIFTFSNPALQKQAQDDTSLDWSFREPPSYSPGRDTLQQLSNKSTLLTADGKHGLGDIRTVNTLCETAIVSPRPRYSTGSTWTKAGFLSSFSEQHDNHDDIETVRDEKRRSLLEKIAKEAEAMQTIRRPAATIGDETFVSFPNPESNSRTPANLELVRSISESRPLPCSSSTTIQHLAPRTASLLQRINSDVPWCKALIDAEGIEWNRALHNYTVGTLTGWAEKMLHEMLDAKVGRNKDKVIPSQSVILA